MTDNADPPFPTPQPALLHAEFLVRVLLPVVLVAAAVLKGAVANSEGTPWGTLFLASAETILAIWLLTAWRASEARLASLLVFSSFAGYAATGSLLGLEDCGCFGYLQVPPHLALLIDIGAVILLIACWQRGAWRPVRQCSVRLSIAAMTAFLLGTLTASMRESGPNRDPMTFLDVGKRLALLSNIDIGEELAHGEWVVVIYDPRCPKCQRRLENPSELLAEAIGTDSFDELRLAYVAIPPYRPIPQNSERTLDVRHGRLHESSFAVVAPTVVRLTEGIVSSASLKQ